MGAKIDYNNPIVMWSPTGPGGDVYAILSPGRSEMIVTHDSETLTQIIIRIRSDGFEDVAEDFGMTPVNQTGDRPFFPLPAEMIKTLVEFYKLRTNVGSSRAVMPSETFVFMNMKDFRWNDGHLHGLPKEEPKGRCIVLYGRAGKSSDKTIAATDLLRAYPNHVVAVLDSEHMATVVHSIDSKWPIGRRLAVPSVPETN